MKESNFITTKNNHTAVAYNDINSNEKWNQQGSVIAMDLQERSDSIAGSSTFLQNFTSNDTCNLSFLLETPKLFNRKHCYNISEQHNRHRSNNDDNKEYRNYNH